MNLDELLNGLVEEPDDEGGDIQQGLARLREGLRRLRTDAGEAQRIRDIAELVDVHAQNYQAGREAIDRQDYTAAEAFLRRAAQHGHDEAAYWLGLVLALRSDQLRLAGCNAEADDIAAEAGTWRLHAQLSGVAEALAGQPPQPREEPQAPPCEPASVARARPDDRPKAQQRYAVGIELRPFGFAAVLTDEHGNQLVQRWHNLARMEPHHVVNGIAGAVDGLLAENLNANFPRTRIALGVQLGGPVDTRSGTVHFYSKGAVRHPEWSRPFKWENVSLGPLLRRASGMPTVIENDANTFAMRELWFGIGEVTDNFALLLLREGVGGSIVKDGELFPGPVEIGNFIYSDAGVRESDAGQWGALESCAGTTAVAGHAGDRSGLELDDIEAAVFLAEQDDTPGGKALTAFTAAGVAISCAASYLVHIAAPTHVVLYAPEVLLTGSRAAETFVSQVSQFHDHIAHEAFRHCELVLRNYERYEGAHGAALTALQRCFDLRPIRQFSSVESR
jgi:glucokinase